MLDVGTQYALSAAWWSWDAAVVRRALWSSVLSRFRALTRDSFQQFRTSGSGPTSWQAVNTLGRNHRTVERVLSGQHNLCPEFLLGAAAVLGIDTHDCFPETETWIAEATVYLSSRTFGGKYVVPTVEARTYTTRIVPIVAAGPYSSQASVLEQLDLVSNPDRAVVRKVAGAIAPVLALIAPKC